ncbi:tripartite tricarboxylate transporter substrate binding protein [Hoeflea olei]|uniref:Transporter n=1 Tax=Hoeflea olei TaxID=1480615 RepID=A0A1C1Z1H7_9HYPH|nr:tripartite tricarboxylate transporter substrate binding protein [Hoeflea olei]OCW59611.1 hypothetical protein AWJ14_11460 [Hoeflea olei]
MQVFTRSFKAMLTAAALTAAAAMPAAAQEFPGGRGIEFVAGYGPGGGHDTMLRMMAKIIQSDKIVDAKINVVNKPGGAGATSLGYLNSHKGDGHYLMSATSSFITTPLTTDVGLNYKDFTPIARLGIDPVIMVVSAKSPIQSLDDVKNADGVLNIAGGGRGQIENIVTILLGDKMDKTFNFIPFQGDGEVSTAVLSGQVDAAMINPGAIKEFIEAGRVRAIAISTDERTTMLPDVPTFKESGFDVVAAVFRGVVAAKDISEEEKSYLSNMVEKLQATDAWKSQYLEPNGIVPGYLSPDDFGSYLEQTNELYRSTLERLNLLKG